MVYIEKKWKLYIHVNKVNFKCYVGITSKENPNHRWNSGRGYYYNKHFTSAINKYGWDGFEHLILYDDLSEDEAKNMEVEFISSIQSNDPKYGYNQTEGGDGSPGYHPSDETKALLSKARRKENLSEETLKRRSDSLKGRILSEAHKRKIGEGNSKAINMYNLDGAFIRTFSSAREAEEKLNISHSHISQCCHDKRRTAGGYMWRFV